MMVELDTVPLVGVLVVIAAAIVLLGFVLDQTMDRLDCIEREISELRSHRIRGHDARVAAADKDHLKKAASSMPPAGA